jgi:hypothetical protein
MKEEIDVLMQREEVMKERNFVRRIPGFVPSSF